jgi:hypothetical protein
MAISYETGNSDEGYAIWDGWSSKGSKYPGPDETRYKWQSFKSIPDNPVGIGTLCKIADEYGGERQHILTHTRDSFKKVSFEIIYPDAPSNRTIPGSGLANPLDRYSLTGSSAELEKNRQDEVFVLAEIALLGQATAIYAAPNCGKTLAVLSLLSDAISDRRINSRRMYYINADDNLAGLIEKVKIAEQFGFHMIGEGYKEFRAENLLDLQQVMIDTGTAAGSVVILDTTKRFTDLMSKKVVSTFTALNRRFVSQGGSVIALAHVNKKKAESGKSVYAGTSDIIDDFDCAYVIEVLDDGTESGKRVIAFENLKSRGSVEAKVFFSYMSPDCVSGYTELLESFCRMDPEDAGQAVTASRIDADAPMIAIVKARIQAGSAAKKDLIAALRDQAGHSRGAASSLIERYCGTDPATHLWTFERGARGVHQYRLLKELNPTSTEGGDSND